MKLIMKTAAVLLLMLAGTAAAESGGNPGDPWEDYNRWMYGVNSAVDRVVLKPVARGYQTVTPRPVRISIGNFFANLDDVDNAVNNFLQGKPGRGFSDLGRVLINSTLGVAGFLDPASEIGLRKHEEDLGQTFSVWGIPSGPYFVMPFLGPSTVTDTLSRPLDNNLDPLRHFYPVDHRNVLFALRLIDLRADLLRTEGLMSGDEYVFVRDAYLQRRNYLVNDGQVEDTFGDDF